MRQGVVRLFSMIEWAEAPRNLFRVTYNTLDQICFSKWEHTPTKSPCLFRCKHGYITDNHNVFYEVTQEVTTMEMFAHREFMEIKCQPTTK